MFKVNNKNTRMTPMVRSGVFIVNLEHTFTTFCSVSIVNFEQEMPAGFCINSVESVF